jgi:hypothetical protein
MTLFLCPDDIQDDYDRLEHITWAAFKWLLDKGVPAPAIVYPELPRASYVSFLPDSNLFVVAEDNDKGAVKALVFLVRGETGEPNDLAAWSPKSDRLASWFCNAWALGESCLSEFYLAERRQVPTFRSPIEWLRHGRQGLVILDADKARWRVAYSGFEIVAEDVPHGQALRRELTIPPPSILVSQQSFERAAA